MKSPLHSSSFRLLTTSLALLFTSLAASAQQATLTLTPLKSTATYEVGEKVGWTVTVTGGTLPSATYTLKKDGAAVFKTDTLDLSSGKGVIETSLDEPGTILLNIRGNAAPAAEAPAAGAPVAAAPRGGGGRRGGRGGANATAGALIAPQKLQPSSPRPADFDTWWAAKIEQLHAIPMNAQLTPADGGKANVDYSLIKMDNINGVHIQGQFAKPKDAGKHPALLVLQWAGVYSLPASRVTDKAAQGWLALNIEPHDMPSNKEMAFYTNLNNTTLRNYQAIGQDDREKSYFLQMYLSAYRALDYLASRDDWDGKTLVVQGTSMGGQQSLAMAGLHPKVTDVIVMVPSSNDVTGPQHGSAAGFPDWARDAQSKMNPKILETAQYFDPMNFSYHTKVPALVAMGLLDETSPPAGVWRAINQMHGQVEPLPMINSPHQDTPVGVQKPYQVRSEEWLATLVKTGLPPPLKAAVATTTP